MSEMGYTSSEITPHLLQMPLTEDLGRETRCPGIPINIMIDSRVSLIYLEKCNSCELTITMPETELSCLCLGPTSSGKTLLVRKLRDESSVDSTSCTIPTVGTNLTVLKLPHHRTGALKSYTIRELGGSMAPLWSKYYKTADKIMVVVDASNLCQISAAGVLLYSILVHPDLQKTKILLVLTKMDLSYRQMRNEALLMLQMKRLLTEVSQPITLLEASAVTGEGTENILKWLQNLPIPKAALLQPK